MSAKTQLLSFACIFGIRCCSFTICTYICNSTFKFPIGHVRYINIRAWLRGFRVKIANFSSVLCPSIPKRDFDTKKTTPNIEVWLESLGAMLEYWYIERAGLFLYFNCRFDIACFTIQHCSLKYSTSKFTQFNIQSYAIQHSSLENACFRYPTAIQSMTVSVGSGNYQNSPLVGASKGRSRYSDVDINLGCVRLGQTLETQTPRIYSKKIHIVNSSQFLSLNVLWSRNVLSFVTARKKRDIYLLRFIAVASIKQWKTNKVENW